MRRLTFIQSILAAGLLSLAGINTAASQSAEGAAVGSNTIQVDNVNRPQIVLHTSKGDIRLELFADRAPNTVNNFLQYAEDGYYDDTIFHRVIEGFMVQGGGFSADMQRKQTRNPVTNEADNGLSNERGTIAMARTGDPHSATSQFFINHSDNRALDHRNKNTGQTWGYAVFGKVLEGMEVVDTIATTETGPIPPFNRDVPLETISIDSVDIYRAN